MRYLSKTKVLFVLIITPSIPILQFQHLIDNVFHNWALNTYEEKEDNKVVVDDVDGEEDVIDDGDEVENVMVSVQARA